ncbi:hypothetical protein N7474_009825 [Penicillium riverlandense]|uniref:uncharacterized protein n=1 Tax=Penicillium riverlandense TaxID=1903569 RepID=UPI00254819BD|nr:uncharacterized protein N7474_009825 [Penicillium riverlandense]KAJ5808556.1 hypothetical protein N7474_009825 [Penicillium riverlandense]
MPDKSSPIDDDHFTPQSEINPALQPEHLLRHAHIHQTAFAELGHDDDVDYAKDASFQNGKVPDPTPLNHTSKSQSDDSNNVETTDNFPAPASVVPPCQRSC